MVQQLGISKVMRKQIVKAKSFAEAYDKCPWANEVCKVRGGYMCVGAAAKCKIWENQK